MSVIKRTSIFLLILLSNNTLAGLKKDDASVKIVDLGSNNFKKITGTMAATRATDDDKISLSVNNGFSSRDAGRASIRAETFDDLVWCSIDDPDMIRLVGHIKSDSYIEVIAGKVDSQYEYKCLDITIKNSSAYAPKQP